MGSGIPKFLAGAVVIFLTGRKQQSSLDRFWHKGGTHLTVYLVEFYKGYRQRTVMGNWYNLWTLEIVMVICRELNTRECLDVN